MPSDRALLVAAGGGLGDTLLAGVVAHALRSRFAQVDALVLPAHRALAEHDPAIDRVHVLASPVPTAEDLRAAGFAAAVVTWATFTNALVPVLAGIPVRVGQARRLYSGLFTDRVVVRSERGDRSSHWTQILLDYPRAIGCDDPVARPAFTPNENDRRAADALLAARDVDGPFAMLHPSRGLSAQRERWPAAGFIALGRSLRERDGLPLLVSGTAADAAGAEAIARGADAISIAGATAIGTFAALAERARYVVAIDSGPMHVAAAVGAPTVGIFALQSDEPDRWAPLGPHTAVVRAVYPCPPGHRKETCPDFACVRHLDTAGIVHALDGLLATIPEPNGSDMPRLTIQLCTYNRARLLERVLEALFDQTVPDDAYEVVLVNDGSPDDTREVIERVRPLARCTFTAIEQANAGLARARNAGIARATGERIVFIDDDVLPTPVFAAEHLASDARHGDVIVRGAVINTESFDDLPVPVWSPANYSANYFWTSNVSLRRARLERAGGRFDESFAEYGWEDIELGMRLRALGTRAVFNRYAVAFHHKPRAGRTDRAGRERQVRAQARTAVQLRAKHPHWRVDLAIGNTPPQRALGDLIARTGIARGIAPLTAAYYEELANAEAAAQERS